MQNRIVFLSTLVICLAACTPQQDENPSGVTSDDSFQKKTLRLPDTKAGDIIRKSIDYSGGWDAWVAKKSVDYRKTVTQLDSLGNERRRLVQRHQYILHPAAKMRISYNDDEGRDILVVNNGSEAWKWINGELALGESDRNSAWNSSFGSHYVFAMPYKLADPGVILDYDGETTMSDGTAAHAVSVDYEPGAGSAGGMHNWTYFFDMETGRLLANHLTYGPEPDDHDYTSYVEYKQIDDLYIPVRRHGFHSNADAQPLTQTGVYINEDIQFDSGLSDTLFVLKK